jgi:hypothetical protein
VPNLASPAARMLCRTLLPLLALALAGCPGKEQPAADSATRDSSQKARVSTTEAPPPDTVPDTLKTRVAAATLPKLRKRPQDDPAEWVRFRDDLFIWRRTATAAERGCEDAPETHSSECQLEIWPVEGGSRLDTLALDTVGVIVARIKNIGTKKEAAFGIDPQQKVYWRIYRRVERDGAGNVRAGAIASQFVDSVTGKPIPRPKLDPHETPFDVPAGFGDDEFPFRVCRHKPAGTPSGTQGRFWSCRTAEIEHLLQELRSIKAGAQTEAQQRRIKQLEAELELQRRKQHNSPAWIACIQGCCSVEEGGP